MTIQILGLRASTKNGLKRTWTNSFKRQYHAPDHATLFSNIDAYIDQIPSEERYNLFYTMNQCYESKTREFESNSVYAFDLDKIDLDQLDKYIELTLEVLKVSRESTAITCSGNGLHFLIQTKTKRNDPKIFDEERRAYKAVCNALNMAFKKNGLEGEADPAIFDKGRILRLPNTLNVKEGKEDKLCYFIQPNIVAVDYSLSHSLGIQDASDSYDFMSPDVVERFSASVDSKAILEECELFKEAKANPEGVSEPHWKSMMSIFAHMENGEELAHEYSRGYAGYNEDETAAKYNAASAFGPMFCNTIEQRYGFDKCKSCIHYKSPTVRSPIQIKGQDFIATRDTGFRKVKSDGTLGAIQYNDLARFFEQECGGQVSEVETGCIYVQQNNHWVKKEKLDIKAFVDKNVSGDPNENNRNEFYSTLQIKNLVGRGFFDSNVENKINLRNGVLHLDTMEVTEHSSEYGFRYILDYDYDPEATCPNFDKFMKEITCNDADMEQALLEYAGYCISNSECYAQKAMVLLGDGSNGKSTFIEVLQELAGEDNYTSVGMSQLSDPEKRSRLIGKLFNVAEETPTQSLKDSSHFKTLVTGGTSLAKHLYQNTFSFKNKTKFLFAANDMPKTSDSSHGLMRRLIIVPFNANFKGKAINRNILNELKVERSGILNRCIKALKDLKANNWEFTKVSAIDEAEEIYSAEINDVKSFADECVTTKGCSNPVKLQVLYDEYLLWCQEKGKRYTYHQSEFAKKLRKLFPDAIAKRVVMDGRKLTVYNGICLIKHQENF